MSGTFDEVWRKVVARSWTDGKYKQELLDDPNKVLTAAGAVIPEGVHFVVVENEPTRLHLVLPTQGIGLTEREDGGQTISEYNAAVV